MKQVLFFVETEIGKGKYQKHRTHPDQSQISVISKIHALVPQLDPPGTEPDPVAETQAQKDDQQISQNTKAKQNVLRGIAADFGLDLFFRLGTFWNGLGHAQISVVTKCSLRDYNFHLARQQRTRGKEKLE